MNTALRSSARPQRPDARRRRRSTRPALLLALGEPVPAGILGHGWLNVGGDGVLEAAAAQAVRTVEQHMERLQPADALAALFRLVSRANKYIEEQSPWSLAKNPAEAERLGGVLYSLPRPCG